MRKFFGLFVVAAAVLMAGCPASQTPIQRASVDVGGDLVTSTGEQNFRDGDEIDQSRIVTGDKATVLAPNREPVDPEAVVAAQAAAAAEATRRQQNASIAAGCVVKERAISATVFKANGETETVFSTIEKPCD